MLISSLETNPGTPTHEDDVRPTGLAIKLPDPHPLLTLKNVTIYGVTSFGPDPNPPVAPKFGPVPGPLPTHKLTLSGPTLGKSTLNLEHPGYDTCVAFIIGAGAKALLGQPGNKWYVWYQDQFWRRATNYELGHSGKCGLTRKVDGKLALWLHAEPKLNEQVIYTALMAELGRLMRIEYGIQ